MRLHPRRFTWLVIFALSIACAGVASAQVWKPFEFTVDERYEYRVESIEYDWESNATSEIHFYTVELRNTGRASSDGEPLFNISTTTTRPQTSKEFSDSIMWGGFLGGGGLSLGNPFEWMFILPAMQELDFEVGERTNIFGFGRLVVTEQVTVAGRSGVLIRVESGDASNRKLASEWIVDVKLALPLIVRSYDDEGRITSQSELLKYERY